MKKKQIGKNLIGNILKCIEESNVSIFDGGITPSNRIK
jgi:hypothetical protein